MKIDKRIKVYGDPSVRLKKPPSESIEQITFINWLRSNHPLDAALCSHTKNEGLKSAAVAAKDAMEGLCKGFSDLIIIGNPVFLCEMKRSDFTKGKLSKEQSEFLLSSQERGAFSCVALGHKGAIEAFKEWKCTQTIKNG